MRRISIFRGRGVNFQLILAWLRQFLQGWKQIGDAFNEWRSRRLAPEEDLKEKSGRSRVRRWLDELMLGRLPPDEQVRYFYVSTLESAAEHGVRRRPGETPYSFQARLGTQGRERRRGSCGAPDRRFCEH